MPQPRMNMKLLRLRLLTRALKLDEQGSSAGDEEQAVRPARAPGNVELEAAHAELFKRAGAGALFYNRL